jgi:hypothetical protein
MFLFRAAQGIHVGKVMGVVRLLLEASAVAPRYVRLGLGLLLLYLAILIVMAVL